MPGRTEENQQERGVRIVTARDAYQLFAPHFESAAQEKLVVAFLDAGRRVLQLSTCAGLRGNVNLPVRLVVAEALRVDAAGLLVAHNHPSGDAAPSTQDVAATRRLADAAGTLGMAVHDHLIFTPTACLSLRALGLL